MSVNYVDCLYNIIFFFHFANQTLIFVYKKKDLGSTVLEQYDHI